MPPRCIGLSIPAFGNEHALELGLGPKWGYTPWCKSRGRVRLELMNIILLLVVLLLLFGGGGFYVGGPLFGGGALGLVLVIALVVYFLGGFRGRA